MTETKMDNSYDTKTIITVLCLIFVYPIGVIMMWVWMKWSVLLKLLLSAVFVIPVFLVVSAGILATVNPAEQMGKARDVMFMNDARDVYLASEAYFKETKKYPFVLGKNEVEVKTFVDKLVASGKLPATFKSKKVMTSTAETDYMYVYADEKTGQLQICYNLASGSFAKQHGASKGDDLCFGKSDFE